MMHNLLAPAGLKLTYIVGPAELGRRLKEALCAVGTVQADRAARLPQLATVGRQRLQLRALAELLTLQQCRVEVPATNRLALVPAGVELGDPQASAVSG